MAQRSLLFLSIFLLLVCRLDNHAAAFNGNVISITDGDTINISDAGKIVHVRLYGIDCPEKKQDYGEQAAKATSDLVLGKSVSVEIIEKDRDNRMVGVVTLSDGRNLNHILVAQGMAWWYKDCAPKSWRLKKLEEEARKAKLGLWSQANPVPPWDYRKQQLQAQKTPKKECNIVYVTPTGRSYHRETCSTIKHSTLTKMTREEAMRKGYKRCKACEP